MDRAHVLASTHLDRHAAYVGLTRHRESVELHWAREDLRDRAGLDRVLSRERSKDTTLDYAAGFAERRGLVPRSEILVPTRTMEILVVAALDSVCDLVSFDSPKTPKSALRWATKPS